MKNFLLLLILPLLFACNEKKVENNDGQNSMNSEQPNTSNNSTPTTNPCDVYLGSWTFKQNNGRQVTVTISSNGGNYLISSTGAEDSNRSYSAFCENNLLKTEGGGYYTYVQDGNYILISGNKFLKN